MPKNYSLGQSRYLSVKKLNGDYWTSRRSRQQFAYTTKPTHWRKVTTGCACSPILLQLRVKRTETDQEGHRSTTPGMDCVIQQLHSVLSEAQPCSYHQNLEGCHPFQYDQLFLSIPACCNYKWWDCVV